MAIEYESIFQRRFKPTPGADRQPANLFDLMSERPQRYKIVPDENLVGSKVARFFLYNDDIICLSPAMHTLVKEAIGDDDTDEATRLMKAIEVHPAINHDLELQRTLQYLNYGIEEES